jgi:hypothetical protein
MTALTANHKEVPANCAKTMMGKTCRGVCVIEILEPNYLICAIICIST